MKKVRLVVIIILLIICISCLIVEIYYRNSKYFKFENNNNLDKDKIVEFEKVSIEIESLGKLESIKNYCKKYNDININEDIVINESFTVKIDNKDNDVWDLAQINNKKIHINNKELIICEIDNYLIIGNYVYDKEGNETIYVDFNNMFYKDGNIYWFMIDYEKDICSTEALLNSNYSFDDTEYIKILNLDGKEEDGISYNKASLARYGKTCDNIWSQRGLTINKDAKYNNNYLVINYNPEKKDSGYFNIDNKHIDIINCKEIITNNNTNYKISETFNILVTNSQTNCSSININDKKIIDNVCTNEIYVYSFNNDNNLLINIPYQNDEEDNLYIIDKNLNILKKINVDYFTVDNNNVYISKYYRYAEFEYLSSIYACFDNIANNEKDSIKKYILYEDGTKIKEEVIYKFTFNDEIKLYFNKTCEEIKQNEYLKNISWY